MSEITHVSDTAFWVAVYRAEESRRKDALFHDPWAERLSGDRGRNIASRMHHRRYTAWSVVIRTCIIDRFLEEKIAEGADTVINLGAGLDTRPYRLKLPPNLRWIEADYPHMIDFKNEALKDETPTCRLERIAVDLSNDESRKTLLTKLGAGTKKAVVLTEGVTPYLTVEQVGKLADDLKAQPTFRYWVLDYFSPLILSFFQKNKKRMEQMKNAPFQFNPPDWFAFYDQHGWKVEQMRYFVEESLRLGRRFPTPWWSKLTALWAGPRKREAFRRLVGYAVLEPK